MHKIRDIYPDPEAKNIACLVLEFLGLSKRELILQGDEEFSNELLPRLEEFSDELSQKKPVQYILGQADFYGLKFRVNEHVMIPRAETEELVDLIIKENSIINPVILDIGTGSGCIGICLGKYIKGSHVTATDISAESIEVAMTNAIRYNVKINFIRDDIFQTVLTGQDQFDILVSNPPYITESEKKWMHQNVLDYEPGLALFVPDDNPLKYYTKIAELGAKILKREGKLYFEINERFGKRTTEILMREGFKKPEIIKDLRGKDRIVKAMRI